MPSYVISSVMQAFWLVLTHDVVEDRRIDDVIIKTFFPYILILYYIKQIDSKLPCVCSVIEHRGRQNVVTTSVTHSAAPRVPLFCSYHSLTSSVMTWNLFVKYCLLEIGRNVWYLNIRGIFRVFIDSARWSWEAGRNLTKLRKPSTAFRVYITFSNSPVRSLAAS